ncbi:unnamed protein product [Gordionus sp. m RMFG-2023]
MSYEDLNYSNNPNNSKSITETHQFPIVQPPAPILHGIDSKNNETRLKSQHCKNSNISPYGIILPQGSFLIQQAALAAAVHQQQQMQQFLLKHIGALNELNMKNTICEAPIYSPEKPMIKNSNLSFNTLTTSSHKKKKVSKKDEYEFLPKLKHLKLDIDNNKKESKEKSSARSELKEKKVNNLKSDTHLNTNGHSSSIIDFNKRNTGLQIQHNVPGNCIYPYKSQEGIFNSIYSKNGLTGGEILNEGLNITMVGEYNAPQAHTTRVLSSSSKFQFENFSKNIPIPNINDFTILPNNSTKNLKTPIPIAPKPLYTYISSLNLKSLNKLSYTVAANNKPTFEASIVPNPLKTNVMSDKILDYDNNGKEYHHNTLLTRELPQQVSAVIFTSDNVTISHLYTSASAMSNLHISPTTSNLYIADPVISNSPIKKALLDFSTKHSSMMINNIESKKNKMNKSRSHVVSKDKKVDMLSLPKTKYGVPHEHLENENNKDMTGYNYLYHNHSITMCNKTSMEINIPYPPLSTQNSVLIDNQLASSDSKTFNSIISSILPSQSMSLNCSTVTTSNNYMNPHACSNFISIAHANVINNVTVSNVIYPIASSNIINHISGSTINDQLVYITNTQIDKNYENINNNILIGRGNNILSPNKCTANMKPDDLSNTKLNVYSTINDKLSCELEKIDDIDLDKTCDFSHSDEVYSKNFTNQNVSTLNNPLSLLDSLSNSFDYSINNVIIKEKLIFNDNSNPEKDLSFENNVPISLFKASPTTTVFPVKRNNINKHTVSRLNNINVKSNRNCMISTPKIKPLTALANLNVHKPPQLLFYSPGTNQFYSSNQVPSAVSNFHNYYPSNNHNNIIALNNPSLNGNTNFNNIIGYAAPNNLAALGQLASGNSPSFFIISHNVNNSMNHNQTNLSNVQNPQNYANIINLTNNSNLQNPPLLLNNLNLLSNNQQSLTVLDPKPLCQKIGGSVPLYVNQDSYIYNSNRVCNVTPLKQLIPKTDFRSSLYLPEIKACQGTITSNPMVKTITTFPHKEHQNLLNSKLFQLSYPEKTLNNSSITNIQSVRTDKEIINGAEAISSDSNDNLVNLPAKNDFTTDQDVLIHLIGGNIIKESSSPLPLAISFQQIFSKNAEFKANCAYKEEFDLDEYRKDTRDSKIIPKLSTKNKVIKWGKGKEMDAQKSEEESTIIDTCIVNDGKATSQNVSNILHDLSDNGNKKKTITPKFQQCIIPISSNDHDASYVTTGNESESTEFIQSAINYNNLILPLPTKHENITPFIPPEDIRDWNVNDVFQFILQLSGCKEYAETFKTNEIDGPSLFLLKEEHFTSSLKMKLGPALKIQAKVAELIRKYSSP